MLSTISRNFKKIGLGTPVCLLLYHISAYHKSSYKILENKSNRKDTGNKRVEANFKRSHQSSLNKIIENPNIQVKLEEQDIYNSLKRQGMLPEDQIKSMIAKSQEFTEADFKSECLSFVNENIKNFLNISIVEICRMTSKNEYFQTKFPEFWERVADEIDERIESSWTNQQIVDITNYLSRVSFPTKKEFFRLMEDTILDTPLPFTPYHYQDLMHSFLDCGLGSAPYLKLTSDQIIKHISLFSLYNVANLTSRLNSHPNTIGGNFGFNKVLESKILEEGHNLKFIELLRVSGVVYKQNLLENKVKYHLEDLIAERLKLNINVELGSLLRFIREIYRYEHFKNSVLMAEILNYICYAFVDYNSSLNLIHEVINPVIGNSEDKNTDVKYYECIEDIKVFLLKYSPEILETNKSIKKGLVNCIKVDETIDRIPDILTLLLANKFGMKAAVQDQSAEGISMLINLFFMNTPRYKSREIVFTLDRIIRFISIKGRLGTGIENLDSLTTSESDIITGDLSEFEKSSMKSESLLKISEIEFDKIKRSMQSIERSNLTKHELVLLFRSIALLGGPDPDLKAVQKEILHKLKAIEASN